MHGIIGMLVHIVLYTCGFVHHKCAELIKHHCQKRVGTGLPSSCHTVIPIRHFSRLLQDSVSILKLFNGLTMHKILVNSVCQNQWSTGLTGSTSDDICGSHQKRNSGLLPEAFNGGEKGRSTERRLNADSFPNFPLSGIT